MQIFSLLMYVFTSVKLPLGTKENSWIKMNAGQTGFYRVNYYTENWQKLINQLKTSHQVAVHFYITLLSNLLSRVCTRIRGSEDLSLGSLTKFY